MLIDRGLYKLSSICWIEYYVATWKSKLELLLDKSLHNVLSWESMLLKKEKLLYE